MRELYLLCHGQTLPPERVPDPHSAALSPEGLAQARALAAACQGWRIEYLGVSTTLHAQETADIIHGALPGVLRRDMQDLEDVTLDDLNLDPTASYRPVSWTREQRQAGLRQAWTRVAAALARVLIYCERNGVARVALVAGSDVLSMLLLGYVDPERRVDEQLTFRFEPGSSTRITLLPDERVRVDWVNRLP
jgi:broad specificity phosphatase PhoE